eukprot:COSAG01_NODE_3831_length_5651_cov_4.363112_3_plen_45_part_00
MTTYNPDQDKTRWLKAAKKVRDGIALAKKKAEKKSAMKEVLFSD